MDYVWFIVFMAILGGLLFLLYNFDKRTKKKYRDSAMALLEATDPDPQKIAETMKMLRLYGGRWHKDQDFLLLRAKLQERLESLPK